jgi:hypothetical protein
VHLPQSHRLMQGESAVGRWCVDAGPCPASRMPPRELPVTNPALHSPPRERYRPTRVGAWPAHGRPQILHNLGWQVPPLNALVIGRQTDGPARQALFGELTDVPFEMGLDPSPLRLPFSASTVRKNDAAVLSVTVRTCDSTLDPAGYRPES